MKNNFYGESLHHIWQQHECESKFPITVLATGLTLQLYESRPNNLRFANSTPPWLYSVMVRRLGQDPFSCLDIECLFVVNKVYTTWMILQRDSTSFWIENEFLTDRVLSHDNKEWWRYNTLNCNSMSLFAGEVKCHNVCHWFQTNWTVTIFSTLSQWDK